jgi:DNA-directed RNA polymerase specialized sigma24 family protein
LNASVSLNRSSLPDALTADGPTAAPLPLLSDSDPDRLPEDLAENMRHLLSDLEQGVLHCYLEGMSYREISRELNCHTKSIDNALQRVKRKIGGLLRSRGIE